MSLVEFLTQNGYTRVPLSRSDIDYGSSSLYLKV